MNEATKIYSVLVKDAPTEQGGTVDEVVGYFDNVMDVVYEIIAIFSEGAVSHVEVSEYELAGAKRIIKEDIERAQEDGLEKAIRSIVREKQ